jgi:hypothetical protein
MGVGATPESFGARADRSGRCWLWIGPVYGNNHYGCASSRGRTMPAHRLAWTIARGPIPAGMKVLHRCDVPLCVRPDHLFLGTQADNMRDAATKGRTSNGNRGKVFCKRGHEFTPENTRHDRRGRQCRTCDKLRPSHLKRYTPQTKAEAKAKDRWE